MFRAAIFDMDGLLIDSEPFWKRAEREVFGSVGIEISDELSQVTATMTTKQVAEYWYRVRPWRDRSVEDLEGAVIARVAELIRAGSVAMPGVRDALDLCNGLGLRIGLASNSPSVLCELVLHELRIMASFDAVVSADRVEEGKPHPAVYLLAAHLLGVSPADCIAFEDSATGVRAARAAGMCVVAVPSAGQKLASGAAGPHVQLDGLHEFSTQHAERLWAARS